jgi:CDP-glucose 4,6-dehydratase
MEGLAMSFWAGRRVLITGHTGFKGGWLSLWLNKLGADVCGLSLPPATAPNMFTEARVAKEIRSEIADIRELEHLKSIVLDHRPEVVFHLAAQPLVRSSYVDPVTTYTTNVIGTVNVLESVRWCESVRSVVVITTDKCYENREWVWAYRETDRLGGHDPYSNSKACAELVVDSYRNSFFPPNQYEKHGVAIATARAGNVIGGGDWSKDRLIPDAIQAFTSGELLQIRNPNSIRPWQHVLEPLGGYLKLAQRLIEAGVDYSGPWNFAPESSDARPVIWIIERLAREFGEMARWRVDESEHPHEAKLLKLDWSKAANGLNWQPTMPLDRALRLTSEWYRRRDAGDDPREITLEQISMFTQLLAETDVRFAASLGYASQN